MSKQGTIRKQEVIELTGLSNSTIDAKGKEGGPYYDPDFPKRFSLTGNRAVGWLRKDIEEWIAKRAATAGTPLPSMPAEQKRRVGRPRKSTTPAPALSTPHTPKAKRRPVEKTLGEAVIEGSDLVSHIAHFLKLPSWTPAMGFLLAHGIAPPEGTQAMDSLVDLKGLDDQPISPPDHRLSSARLLLKEWEYWAESEESVPESLTPAQFLFWCWDNSVETPWLTLINQVNGSGEVQPDLIRQAHLALLMRK